jgi:hypothetical protein
MESRNRFQGTNPASLYLAGRYDNSIPTRFLAPIDCLTNSSSGYSEMEREHYRSQGSKYIHYRGRVEIGGVDLCRVHGDIVEIDGVYLPSQLESTPQLCT